MIYFWQRIAVFLITFMLLSACSSLTPPSTAPATSQAPWKEREPQLKSISAWQIAGKIGVQTSKDSGSANVDWIQRNGQYTVSLYGPLGAGGLKLVGRPGKVTLYTREGKRLTANSPEQLLAAHWGWRLPVSHLNYWIRGVPVPTIPHDSRFDRDHRISTLYQGGWEIQYLSYTHTQGMDLPQRLTISSPSLKAKIVIHEWNVTGVKG